MQDTPSNKLTFMHMFWHTVYNKQNYSPYVNLLQQLSKAINISSAFTKNLIAPKLIQKVVSFLTPSHIEQYIFT